MHPYESMLAAIYIVWAVMLWRASGNLQVMLYSSISRSGQPQPMPHDGYSDPPLSKDPVMTVVESLPLLVIAALLWWLRPRRPA